MLLKLLFILCLATLTIKGVASEPVNLVFESSGKSLKLGQIKLGDLKEVRVQKSTASCTRNNKGLMRMAELHLEFCDGKSWVRLLDEKIALNSRDNAGVDCMDIKKRGNSKGDGMYWLDPDGGSHSNAFLAYCDMTTHHGGWTMCYTTADYVKPRTQVTCNSQFPYGNDGYRTNCNNIPFKEIIFIDHQTGRKAYFKRRNLVPITAAVNYWNSGSAYGLWDGVGASSAYSYQLLICDHSFYSGFFVSGYTRNCFKQCSSWCGHRDPRQSVC